MAYRFKAETVIEAIQGSNGIITNIAHRLGCSRATALRFVNKWECTRQALDDETQSVLDAAESKLFQQMNNSEPWAVQFLLKTKGKHRGYTEKTEFSQEFDGEINFRMIEH